ncbi:MAG TPA: nuclear transport factor 2 family protein [Quisquiliibacterium sp.]|nr:nuclear transport factor 2 family protein [Quisquiliibacterium sp.]
MNHETGIRIIEEWHRLVRERDMGAMNALLDDEVVFHSPVVHSPQKGKAITSKYLAAALEVLNNDKFTYLREIVGERDAMLEFTTEIDGVLVNGVDIIRWNDAGRIVDFKVMVRPLKAIDAVHRQMGAMLQRLAG